MSILETRRSIEKKGDELKRVWEWLPPNGLRISRRERAAYESAKIPTILRAKRSCCMRVFGGSRDGYPMYDEALECR